MAAGRMVGSLIGAFGGRALGGMIGGPAGRMVGSLLGSVLGGRGGGLGGLTSGLGSLLGRGDDDDAPGELDDETAMILLRAMTQAAKADGEVSAEEVDAIIERAGDLDAEEQAILRAEMDKPVDVDALVVSVPAGMERDVYVASLLPIDVDTIAEREYLQALADGLGLTESDVTEIHDAVANR